MDKTTIVVKFAVEGIHRWANCPFEDVGFLRHDHRHLFYITAEKKVSHDDRDIEIIMLKRTLSAYLRVKYGQVCQFKEMSCEMIARELFEVHNLESCEVLEDNENGAKIVKV